MAESTRLNVSELQPGMTVARQVLDPRNNQVLVPQGAVLTETIIARLAERGVWAVAVVAERGPRGHFRPQVVAPRPTRVGGLLRDETVQDAVATYRQILTALEGQAKLDAGTAAAVVDTMLDEILANLDVVSAITTLKEADEYTYRHAVGACLVLLTVGSRMQYDRQTLRDLGLATLLMDIGMLRVPRPILKKPGRLTPEEHAIMQQHVEWGYQILRTTRGVRPLVAQLAYQHHERWDGAGYPRGLDGHAINPHAQLIALADVYDAMTSDRPMARAKPPFVVAEHLLAERGKQFNPGLCTQFVSNLLNYTPGVTVELSDGRLATVVARHPTWPTRPLVRLPDGSELDLASRLAGVRALRLAGDHLVESAG